MKRKRKNTCPSPPLLDDSPKRTKVHAQRKFAQGSNVNSPVITPIRELESDSPRNDVLPEPVELLPIKRPNTEDFLTFLCFRGTPILPPSLNFFNTASIVDTNGQVHEIKSESSQKNGPIDITKCGTSTDKPFIAFGVRKRADPIVISRQMDRKRRHALAIQALRRKYQEQKMAKIRALTISKLSEKVTNRTLVKTNTVSKTETVTKKTNSSQKTKVVATKHVKVTTQTLKTTMRPKMGQKMCLRSFRGRIVQKELPFIKHVGPVKNVVRKTANQKSQPKELKQEISEESKPIQQSSLKKLKETTVGTSSRVTRSGQVDNKSEVRRKQIRKRILRLTTVKKTVVSQRKSRSIKAKKRLRTVQKLSAPENNTAAKAVKKGTDEKANAKKSLVGARKYNKQPEKKDTSQVNKKPDQNLSDNKEEAKDTVDIKKDFKKVTDYKRESKEIIEKDKKQVNKRVDIKKEISKSTDIKRNPKNMVETKKSIRISNIIQRKETKNANNTNQSTSEEYKRSRRVHKEMKKNEEEKTTEKESDGKLQKKSLILKKTRSQSQEQAKELTKKVDADSKHLRKEKCIAVIPEKPKDIEMEGPEMKKTAKAVLFENLNRTENTEENHTIARSCLTPETSEKSRDIAEIIQDSGSKQCLENKSNSKKKSPLDRKNIKEKVVEDDKDNMKPVSNKIKNPQTIDEEINSSEPKKAFRAFGDETKCSKSVESHGYKLKEKTIKENKNVGETEIDLKTDGKEKNRPVNISNSNKTYSESESEIMIKSLPEEKRINEYFKSETKVVEDEKPEKPVSRKIMNFKEVVEAILEAKDSDESDSETKIIMTQKTSVGDVSTVGPTSLKNYWNHPTIIGIEMATVSQEIPTEYADVDKKPLIDIKRESKKMNVEELKSPDIDSKIFPSHVKMWDTKEIASDDAQKTTEIEKDKKEKVVEKFTKDEKRQSSESQKSKKVTSGKEKSINEAKNLVKVMNKKRTRTKSLRKESTEEIEELNNITDKMRKLDTKTTEPFIQDGRISEAKSSVENKCKYDDSKFLISKELAETRNPEIYSLHDQTTKKIDRQISNDKMKSETNGTVQKPENTRKEEGDYMIEKEFMLNQKLKNMIEAEKPTESETLNMRGTTEKLDKQNVQKSQELLLKSTETKITEKAVEKYIQSDQNDSEQHEQERQITETEVQSTKRQNVKKSVSDKTAGDTDRTNPEIEIPKTENGPKNLLTPTKSKKEVAKKDEKIADIDHTVPKTSQRPSRKTKEAAAIYMEILSHKLVRESRIDDDNISIDSFPELPNVKKTEQRENELKKAQVKTSRDEKSEEKTENTTIDVQESSHEMNVEDIPDDIKLNDLKHRLQTAGTSLKKPVIPRRKSTTKTKIQDQQFSDSDEIDIKTLISRMSEEKIEENDQESVQKDEKVLPKRQSRCIPQTYRAEDSYGSDESFHVDVKVSRQKKFTRSKTASKQTKSIISDVNQEKNVKPASSKVTSTSDESTTSDVNLQVLANKAKSKKFSKTKSVKKTDLDFSDSDEEPLSKLTVKSVEGSQKSVVPTEKSKGESYSKAPAMRRSSPRPPDVEAGKPEAKPKRECAKIPQNYLPMFSSSDEEDIFHGFDKKTEKTKPPSGSDDPAHLHAPPLLDLLNKDLSRRFGKEKVNMSNEQIEQWLKDSALAGSNMRKENDDMLKFDQVSSAEKPPTKQEQAESDARPATAKPDSFKPQLDRKLIFRKNKKEAAAPNINAFSPENESSVYAFGEENEDVISTPFRRPSRRPSSTATSRSEDEDGRFRKPISAKQVARDEADAEAEDNTFYIPQTPSKPCPTKFPNKPLLKISRSNERLMSEPDDFKYKVPSSPSASSSSSTKLYKRPTHKPKCGAISPAYASDFPKRNEPPGLVEAPVFHPTEQEFQDPLEYIERIRHKAEQFGFCRIVPPSTFKPECKVSDDMRFTAYNQYVHKMLHRWGPNFKELMAIKKYLETQNISLVHPPWIGGMEIDLPKLYQTVQTLGGLKEVIEKKKWPRVSELMKIPKSAQDRVTKLDDIYCKYLLPYDTLSMAEREKLFDEVETDWAKRESKSLMKLQEKPTNAETGDNDSDFEDDADECITKGRNMALNAFYRIARNTMSMYFKTNEPTAQEVEQEYWKYVTARQNHICVNSGSIDSGSWGYGFAVAKNSPFARHPWNLKVLTNNSGSLLRSIAPLMAVTVPTLHVGMVFSACCWYRDPHGLPWIEYLHTGGSKIWYGIPDSTSDLFRSALRSLAPNHCKDKQLWLPSDTVMVPPGLLVEHGVSLCRTVQQPGQFVVVFPKAFTSGLSTGYTVSESVYFAPAHWLRTAGGLFDALRASREPSMFSLDRLLIGIAHDSRCSVEVLRQAAPRLQELCDREAKRRARLGGLGQVARERLPLPEVGKGRKKARKGEEGDYECDVCRTSLFVSMIFDTVEGTNYCLDHGIEMLEAKKSQLPNCKFMFTYDDEELAGLPDKIKASIESRGQKKVPNKYAGMPTLLAK